MIRNFIALLLFAFSVNANAGFVTGLVVGSMLSGSSKTSNTTPMFVSSDQHDTIACVATRSNLSPFKCYSPHGSDLTPGQFAYAAGYKILYKTGVIISGDTLYITMEVSK